jgi:hypothetical protein
LGKFDKLMRLKRTHENGGSAFNIDDPIGHREERKQYFDTLLNSKRLPARVVDAVYTRQQIQDLPQENMSIKLILDQIRVVADQMQNQEIHREQENLNKPPAPPAENTGGKHRAYNVEGKGMPANGNQGSKGSGKSQGKGGYSGDAGKGIRPNPRAFNETKGDWQCTNCKMWNYAYRATCFSYKCNEGQQGMSRPNNGKGGKSFAKGQGRDPCPQGARCEEILRNGRCRLGHDTPEWQQLIGHRRDVGLNIGEIASDTDLQKMLSKIDKQVQEEKGS